MSLKVLCAVTAAIASCVIGSAMAQDSPINGSGPSSSPPGPPRIEVNPRPIYRRCASRYVIQYRPSGTVLFPEKHCWWQRG